MKIASILEIVNFFQIISSHSDFLSLSTFTKISSKKFNPTFVIRAVSAKEIKNNT